MQLNTYLLFNGHCEAAMKFYEQCLGAKIRFMMTWGDSPMKEQSPPGWQDKIMHATLGLNDTNIAGSDPPPEHYEQPKGFSLLLNLSNPQEAERIFNALAEGGTVQMPIQQTFWALRFGAVVDRFGIPWGINCEAS